MSGYQGHHEFEEGYGQNAGNTGSYYQDDQQQYYDHNEYDAHAGHPAADGHPGAEAHAGAEGHPGGEGYYDESCVYPPPRLTLPS